MSHRGLSELKSGNRDRRWGTR